MAVSLTVPSVSALFRFGPLHWNDLGLALGISAAVLVALELLKPLWRRQLRF